ncbi:MAG: hypothetical protein WD278_00485 [Pirellulales bacterium]
MDVAWQILFPLLILCLAAGLLHSHLRTWRWARGASLDRLEYDFRRRQFRRRVQASAMLALVGIALFAGQLLPWRRWPSLYVFFWCGVMLLVFWVALLALADVIATNAYARRLRTQRLVEQAQRRARLEEEPKAGDGRAEREA